MFRTVGDQASLWESLLPEELLVLPAELARVDVLLDDPVFFMPFMPFFDARMGRPSTPMETYLRLMFLKVVTGWGMRRYAGRWRTRSSGGGSAVSRWMGRCRIRPR